MIFLTMIMIISAIIIYTCGELYNKKLKYLTGLFIAPIGAYILHSYIPLICWVSYLIATSFGYGDNNWLTKLLGKRGAITFCGFVFGIASMPILGIWGLLQAFLSAGVWYWLDTKDGVINEPYVGIIRSGMGVILLWKITL